MDKTETETDAVETLETRDDALPGTGEAWSAKRNEPHLEQLAQVPGECPTAQ